LGGRNPLRVWSSHDVEEEDVEEAFLDPITPRFVTIAGRNPMHSASSALFDTSKIGVGGSGVLT